MGKILVIIGILIVLIGLLMHYTSFNFNWFGRLPGDIRMEKPGFSLYIPWVSMLLVSLVVSGLFWLIRKINL